MYYKAMNEDKIIKKFIWYARRIQNRLSRYTRKKIKSHTKHETLVYIILSKI